MAKAQRSSSDVSAEFLSSLTELNKAAAKADFSKLQSRTGALSRGIEVCPVYLKVRPFLDIIIRIPFIPKAAKDGIKLLMQVLDVTCPK